MPRAGGLQSGHKNMTQDEALTILKSGANVFLTGEPGSGKTYTINRYVSYLRSHGIEPAITASTGIAATHIGGVTIHSWSGIGIRSRLAAGDLKNIATNRYVKKRINKACVLIIDEISMLPPQTLQMIDSICREVKKNHQPFGGLQIVLVGDFFQLPPVTKQAFEIEEQGELFKELPQRFAYDAPVWAQTEFVTCYITEQYRQDDSNLVLLLSKIRANKFDTDSLKHIEKRKIDIKNYPADAPKLYSHNADVDSMNNEMLAKVPDEQKLYSMETKGHERLIAVMKKGCLSPDRLYLKVGAAVMFTKNNPKEGYVNGTLGVVESYNKKGMPVVKLRDGKCIQVAYADWSVEEEGKVKGTLSQLPLRLAWALTVHKSQGISLDEAVIDLSKVFEFGQGYVALSRVRRLSGLHLIGWNEIAFRVDPEVLKKDIEFRMGSEQALKVYVSFKADEAKRLEEDFIKLCGGALDVSDVVLKSKKPKVSTYDETLKLWRGFNNVAEIASARNLGQPTILDHLEKLAKKGKIERHEFARILPKNILIDMEKIQIAILTIDNNKLTAVFEHFKGQYSYEELKIARLMIESELG